MLVEPDDEGIPTTSETELQKLIAAAGANAAREYRIAKERSATQRLLSLMAFEGLVVSDSGSIVFETPNASEALGLCRRRGERASFPEKGPLAQAVQQYRSNPKGFGQAYRVTTVEHGCGEQGPLYLLPLPHDAEHDPEGDANLLAVLAPLRADPPTAEALAVALSLTLAEAKVVRRILNGERVNVIAEEMRLSEQTVRTYLKRVYGKLGVSGQCELIAKVSHLLIPLRAMNDACNRDW
ncbi:MAG: helix-turn-helix transcriptional regulator [Parvularcula sp.]|nr:helix-turn-helix transcriptional regulator [Parvularcula sp.]